MSTTLICKMKNSLHNWIGAGFRITTEARWWWVCCPSHPVPWPGHGSECVLPYSLCSVNLSAFILSSAGCVYHSLLRFPWQHFWLLSPWSCLSFCSWTKDKQKSPCDCLFAWDSTLMPGCTPTQGLCATWLVKAFWNLTYSQRLGRASGSLLMDWTPPEAKNLGELTCCRPRPCPNPAVCGLLLPTPLSLPTPREGDPSLSLQRKPFLQRANKVLCSMSPSPGNEMLRKGSFP